jgi:hypothetical protein
LSGTGALGSSITLSSPAVDFPTAVVGKSGNQVEELSWLPVPGATSYKIRYSFVNGGPFLSVAATTTGTNFVVRGLTNGLTYYFAVTAATASGDGTPSEQVVANPFDTTKNVFCSGSMSEGGQFTPNVQITSANVTAGLPSYIGSEQMCGILNLQELDGFGYGNLQKEFVGSKGYMVYDWNGSGVNAKNIPANFTLTPGSGWSDIQYLQRQVRLDGTLGSNMGVMTWGQAPIAISVTDTNFHYLTVISPSQFNNGRQFTMRLTSTDNTSASFPVNESPGNSHVFQFLFRGNVTLWADASNGGSGAIVQTLLFDDAAVSFPAALTPPAQFHIVQ